MTTSNSGPNRGITPGLPTNTGSFKASERAEASGVALMDPEPVPIRDAIAESAHGMLRIEESEFGRFTGFDYIDVMPDPSGGYVAYPTKEIDLAEDLAAYVAKTVSGVKEVDEAEAHEAVTKWLSESGGETVNAVLAAQYGMSNDDTRDWDMEQRVYAETELAADATTDQVVDEASTTSASNFGEDYDADRFFDQVLTQHAVTSGAMPYVDGQNFASVRYGAAVKILDANNPRLATSMAPRLAEISRPAERDANEIRVSGRDDYRKVDGALNGRAREGDSIVYQVPGQVYPAEFDVQGMKQVEDGSWVYLVRNTDTGDVHEENLRGPFWKRASWMGAEENER